MRDERKRVEMMRKRYPEGSRIILVSTSDPYTKLKPGDTGTVVYVDDMGTVHISWDNGSSLGMVPGEDQIQLL